jgi:hypothetical protein
VSLFSLGCVDVDSCLVFDDERDGILRKDLFFLGTSVGFRTVCEDVSFDFGIESALTVGDSVGAVVVGLMELGTCKVSKALPYQQRGAKSTRTHTHKVGVERAAALEDAPRS